MASVKLEPVSTALEADLRNFVRRNGVAVWLDADNHYGGFVEGLMALRSQKELPYEVCTWRGSHLRLMLDLEPMTSGVGMKPVVIHMPGFNQETIKETPVLEAYLAGKRYQKALKTLVMEAAAGRVRPDEIAAFRDQEEVSLVGADAWLAAKLDHGEGGLAAVLQGMGLGAIVDDLLTGGFIAGRLTDAADRKALLARLEALTGMSEDWKTGAGLKETLTTPKDIAAAVASWALCVEYVNDLERPPLMESLRAAGGLPEAVIEGCGALAAHLRKAHKTFYRRTADETEVGLVEEVGSARAEDLGKIDTFRFEEDKVLKAALVGLGEGKWKQALGWANHHVEVGSFWLDEDPSRRSAWQLVQGAAALWRAIEEAGPALEAGGEFEGAVERYKKYGAAVDQAHRHLEQHRVALLYSQVPEFESLRARLDELRRRWEVWADGWARDFNTLCKSRGFLPAPELQQRNLFEEDVRPLTQESGVTALFVVDALRYEMAEELKRALEGASSTRVTLSARLAELPTVTSVGMNVLAPVTMSGKLKPVMDGKSIKGFSTGEFQVTDPDSRRRAMHDRVGGLQQVWLNLDQVVGRDTAAIKKSIARSELIVIHSQEIDNAGEKGVGPSAFDHVLQRLRAAWRILRDAGVKRFVFTADHGFLILDDLTPSLQSHGRKIDPFRRHIISPVGADNADEARVPLSDLGYEDAEGHLIFPMTTALFDRGNKPTNFVHGGNSLQERLIPVLVVRHHSPAGQGTARYELKASFVDGIAGLHCLKGKVELADQIALPFGAARELELALRVCDVDDVQVELVQTRGAKARIEGSTLVAPVGEEFELFFRLIGLAEARVQVELHHPSAVADVGTARIEKRYAVTVTEAAKTAEAGKTRFDAPAASTNESWLEGLPEGGVRQVFAHLAAHGTVTEEEASQMLGGQTWVRIFSLKFEEYAGLAPFRIRIETVGNIKRYVREGRGR